MNLQSQTMMATTLAMKSPYPERNVVNTVAELRIFHGQIAKARNSTINCPRGMVMYRGSNMLASEPKGIMLAAMFVPSIDTIQQNASRKIPNRVVPDQYLFRIASSKSQGFQSSSPQELLIAAVERMPKDAESVTANGLVISWDHWAPLLVLLHLAISGWLVMRVAVFPIPLFIALSINQPLLPVNLEGITEPRFPLVLTMQKMNRPHTAGRTTMDLNQKNERSW